MADWIGRVIAAVRALLGAAKIEQTADTANLRTALRGETAKAHDLLDRSMRAASGWNSPADYSEFLTLQYSARIGVEAWLVQHAPPRLRPPPQCPLIADDLIQLGAELPAHRQNVVLPASAGTVNSEARDAQVLGAAWVLAGSALGNKSIMKELEGAGHGHWPSAFLGSGEMLQFWKRLRPLIERPASDSEISAVSRSASAIFAHFTAIANTSTNTGTNINVAASAIAEPTKVTA